MTHDDKQLHADADFVMRATGIDIKSGFDALDAAVKELVMIRAKIELLRILRDGGLSLTKEGLDPALRIAFNDTAKALENQAKALRAAAEKESPAKDVGTPPGIVV